MTFSPQDWFLWTASLALLSLTAVKLKQPRSLRYLMIFLIIGQIVSAIVRQYPVFYWDQLWVQRGLGMCWFLWVAADVSWPGPPPLIMRFPVIMNAKLFIMYNPFHPRTTVREMETYLASGFALAAIIAAIGLADCVRRARVDEKISAAIAATRHAELMAKLGHLKCVRPIPNGHTTMAGCVLTLPAALAACLLCECLAAVASLWLGCPPEAQMLLWIAGLAALAVFAARTPRSDGVAVRRAHSAELWPPIL